MKIQHLSIALLLLNSLFFSDSNGQNLRVEIQGAPFGGENWEVGAPIYVINGNAVTNFKVSDGEDIHVEGRFIFTMDDAASPNVSALGDYTITRDPDWNADMSAASVYKISSFGNLIRVQFRHLARQKSGGNLLIEGQNCTTGEILSQGSMVLVSSDPYYLSGTMGGYVLGRNGRRVVKRCNYANKEFSQSVDVETSDWGLWDGTWDLSVNAKGRISGTGNLQVGQDEDPVETVPQTITGSVKNGIYTWSAAGRGRDRAVQVRIVNTSSDVVDGKNQVSAAAQNRKF